MQYGNPYFAQPFQQIQPYQDRLAQLQNSYQQAMGYHPDRSDMEMGDMNRKKSRYGESYDRYDENRRHYHDSKDTESKRKMDDSMKEYTSDIIRNLTEMWSDADATLRQSMKTDLTRLVQQMN